jgi:hypothetical protein
MILDCLARVIRTGGIKTAPAAEQRADGNLVEAQQRDQYRLHSVLEPNSRRAAKRVKRMRDGIGTHARTSTTRFNLGPIRAAWAARAALTTPAPARMAAAMLGAARSRPPPCPAASRFPFGTALSRAVKPRSAALFCPRAWTDAAARPSRRIARGADESSHARSVSQDYAWQRAAQTFCRRRCRAGPLGRLAARRRRSASNGATGANEKRMKIHPFLEASRLWGRLLALATEPGPIKKCCRVPAAPAQGRRRRLRRTVPST